MILSSGGYLQIKTTCAKAGLDSLLRQLEQQPPPATQLLNILRRSLYQAWIGGVMSLDERLQGFRGEYHDQVVEQFAELDRKMVRLAAHRVIEQYNVKKPSGVYFQTQDSELGLLRREAAKKRRHLPFHSKRFASPEAMCFDEPTVGEPIHAS
jgi:hypothetical protein